MAGLISQNMPGGADPEMEPGGVPEGPGHEQAESPALERSEDATAGAGGSEDDIDLEDPTYLSALKQAMATLYRKGAAKQLAAAVRTAPSPAQGLADAAYKMTQIVDEQTGGEIPENLIGVLACQLLGEVAEIANAAGVKVASKEIAEATRLMLEMYLDEAGADPAQTQQIKQQMASMSPDQVGAQAEMGA